MRAKYALKSRANSLFQFPILPAKCRPIRCPLVVPLARDTFNALSTISAGAVILVAALHLYFMVLEMFFWAKPPGPRAFGRTPEFAQASKTLAANQGLYNGFLASGLLWGVYAGPTDGDVIKVFFPGCVIVAGIFAAPRPAEKFSGCRRAGKQWAKKACSG